ncbi:hypothetical protein JW698_02140 [Candidatus Wolfebacteria bacterium]|nr:hypothetical protein [Candidatus Wolfebacteria bacterium]
MTNNIYPKKRRKMADIVAPVRVRSRINIHSEIKNIKPEVKKEKIEKIGKIDEEFKKLDKKIEEFEQQEKKRFKEEEKKKRNPFKKIKFKKIKIKTYLSWIITFIVLAGIFYSVIEFLPKANIKIVTKKFDWNYIDSIIAGKEFIEINFIEKQIPAEVFSFNKNYNFSFMATGRKMVEEKAEGKITIYNIHSSDSQVLIANTRFKSPDGKIFRLKEKVIVPGAKIIEGKIIPSSVDAVVVADEPGPEYNIGPVNKFSIPGFEDSPKYEDFYAVSQQTMSGGFIGEKTYATKDDIIKAKEEAQKGFENHIKSFASFEIPSEFKIIEGASQFTILKEEINEEINEKEEFTVFLEGKFISICFRESDLKTLLEELAWNDLENDLKIKTYELEYGIGRADFDNGQISFAIDFNGVFEKPIDIEYFEQKVLNKNEEELKEIISLMPNIQKTTISFWPFWVKRVPENIKKVNIDID